MNYDELPAQTREDVDKLVVAYYNGGAALAESHFRAIRRERSRNMTHEETVALGQAARARLAELGYLPVVAS